MSVALRYLVADGYNEAIVWTVEGYERGIAFYEAMGWGGAAMVASGMMGDRSASGENSRIGPRNGNID